MLCITLAPELVKLKGFLFLPMRSINWKYGERKVMGILKVPELLWEDLAGTLKV